MTMNNVLFVAIGIILFLYGTELLMWSLRVAVVAGAIYYGWEIVNHLQEPIQSFYVAAAVFGLLLCFVSALAYTLATIPFVERAIVFLTLCAVAYLLIKRHLSGLPDTAIVSVSLAASYVFWSLRIGAPLVSSLAISHGLYLDLYQQQ
jgi:mannose/fructose/N-acetylgalactosamine-specific phosphotransferase system component IID